MSGYGPVSLLIGVLAAPQAQAQAQEIYVSVEEFERASDTPQRAAAETPCDETVQEDGSIIVCGRLEDFERYMSPLPRGVDPKIRILPGFEPPPCENHLLSYCGGFGGGGDPPLMINLDAIPEALTAEERALVFRAESEQVADISGESD